jgi:hypothetical protein
MRNVFYKATTKNFTNALKFWDHVILNNEEFHFHLYDEQFSAADWTQEPTESFDELCAKRAKMIREKYDYVRIWYSAGRDSHHILKIFLENNLRVDELIIMDWSIMARFATDATIAYDTAIKTFNEYSQPIPIICVLKPGKDEFNRYFHKDWFLEYGAYGCNYNFNLNHYPSIVESMPELALRKNHCEVFGFEKSKVHTDENNRFYFQMNEKNFNQGLGNQDNTEWFYLSGDMPELAIKQCHMFVNHLKSVGVDDPLLLKGIQESSEKYDQFASIMGRGPMVSSQTGGGVNKTFGFNHYQYSEIWLAAYNEQWEALNNYQDFVSHVLWLRGLNDNTFFQGEFSSFSGVPTKKYYLT